LFVFAQLFRFCLEICLQFLIVIFDLANFKGQNLVLQVQSQLNQGKIKNNMAKPLFGKPKP
jgi:hypothetical protein